MPTFSGMNGKQLLVQISDGASPEVFTHDCLINTDRGIAFASETTRESEPNCDDPDAVAWTVVDKSDLSATITGAGKVHTASIKEWDTWYQSNDAKNVRILLNGISLANGGGYWAGAVKLTAWEITGPEKGRATVSVTLESHGALTWVDAAA